MEASEKPQLPLDHGSESVRVIDDRLVIERLEVHDAGAARVVRERAQKERPPAETVARAIEIGARLIESEGTAANVDYVNAKFQEQMGGLADQLARILESGSEELAERISASFGPERSDSVQQQIREMMVKANEHQRLEMVRLFNAEEGANPLSDFKSAVTAKVVEASQRSERQAEALRELHGRESKELREQIAALMTEVARLTERSDGADRLAEAEEAGTRKGRSFEELVHGELTAFAEGHDDAAHHVGDTSSEAGGKMGDTVVEVGAACGPAQATIVFEAKNRKLSKNDAWDELNGAMQERDASYAVLVVAGEDKIPSGLKELTEYQGNKMIAVLDREAPDSLALRLVYRYVRAKALAVNTSSFEVDAAGVRAATEEAQSRLKTVNRIRKSLTSITTSADKAREDVDQMVDDVERCLSRVESLIEVAGTDE
jgi:hypothetical protein